jgi:hypothetical protein
MWVLVIEVKKGLLSGDRVVSPPSETDGSPSFFSSVRLEPFLALEERHHAQGNN